MFAQVLARTKPMETLLSKIKSALPVPEGGTLQVFALYEDSVTSARAEKFCEILVSELAEDVQVVKRCWMVNELRMARLRSIAAKEAADSEVVVLSLRHAVSLGTEVETWLEGWAKDHPSQGLRHRKTLVALFDPVYTGDSSSLHAYLEHVATQANLEFIEHAEDLPVREEYS